MGFAHIGAFVFCLQQKNSNLLPCTHALATEHKDSVLLATNSGETSVLLHQCYTTPNQK